MDRLPDLRHKASKARRLLKSRALKALWKLRNGPADSRRLLFIFGVQRSGTTMMGEILGESPEIRSYKEGHRAAFIDFRLRDDDAIHELLSRSAQQWTVLKPLMDSHRANELLDAFPGSRALWLFRHWQDRVNSSVRTFGDTNLQFLRSFAEGRDLDSWAAQGLEPEDLDLIRRLKPDTMSPESAAALFWVLRNQLFFRQGLDRRPEVRLVSYEDLVAEPETVVTSVCGFLQCSYFARMIRGIHSASVRRGPPPDVAPEIRQACDRMMGRLERERTEANA